MLNTKAWILSTDVVQIQSGDQYPVRTVTQSTVVSPKMCLLAKSVFCHHDFVTTNIVMYDIIIYNWIKVGYSTMQVLGTKRMDALKNNAMNSL